MVMSFLLHEYDQTWKDKILTAHAERGYWSFHAPGLNEWNNFDGLLSLYRYIASWGFYVSAWVAPPGYLKDSNWQGWQPSVEPFLRAICNDPQLSQSMSVVLGKELDSFNRPGRDGLDDIITGVCNICNGSGVPVWLHFNANKPTWQGDGLSDVDWCAQWKGKVTGLCSQLNVNDSPGTQGARLWDARLRWRDSGLVAAFEHCATNKLYGRCDETTGARHGWQLICTTRDPATDYPAVAGSCDGLRRPDGSAI
jgi:hypothetical protein